MVPFSITIDAAAAPHASLAFMFWGEGLFVFPLMLVYAAVSYGVFRGKVRPMAEHYEESDNDPMRAHVDRRGRQLAV